MSSSASNTDSLIGSLVGDYKLVELRSDGTHYAVYRAVHRKLDRSAEVRVHHLHRSDAAMHDRVEQMARRIGRIRHPHVVELYDYGRLDDGRAYVIREWVDGELLSERVNSLSPIETRKVLSEVCSGLAAMHDVGLAHGELSMMTVMLEEPDGAVEIIGPLLDRASEELEAASVSGDIHALGSLIGELLGAADGEAATGVGDQDSYQEIDEIVRKCSITAKGEKFESAVSVAQALDKVLAEKAKRDDGLSPGTLIGETYRICSVLGSGGMGKVYEAVHKRLPQRVAIKVISGEHRDDALARFKQEAEIASSVGHPHIVRVFDFNTLPDGRPYMVMELLEGEDLAKVLGRGAVPKDKALAIAGQVGSALAAAHAKGIVHRDLKPPNIFLGAVDIGGSRREHATVLDFGVSKREGADSSITRTEAIIGTPRYMAPEQAMGKHEDVGPHSDQFALACIVYEMLSGRRCFGGRDLAEIVHSVCYVEPIELGDLCPELDPAIARAVKRAMSKRSELRFASMADFVAALEGRSIAAASEPASEAMKPEPSSSAVSRNAATMATVASGPASRNSSKPKDAAIEPTQVLASKSSTLAKDASSVEPTVNAVPPKAAATDATEVDFLNADVAAAEAGGRSTTHDSAERASGMSMGFLLGLLVAVSGLVLVVFVLDFGKEGDTSSLEQAVNVPSDSQEDSEASLSAKFADAEFRPILDAANIVDAGQPDSTPKGKSHPTNSPKLAKEVVDVLESAERLLRAGQYYKSRKTLRRSPAAAKTPQGFAITVMSYCGEHDFGAATDWFERVSGSDRRRVLRYCKSEHDVDLN